MKKALTLTIIFFSIGCFAQDSLNITMSNIQEFSLEELKNIKVVSAEKREQHITDIPANVVVITRQEIEDLGYRSYNEILNHITGLYKVEDYYWLGSVNYGVRGFYNNGPFSNMVFLVDGVSQLSDKYSDYPNVKTTVPVEAIERIEVIRGPMAVMYGNSAFFGAINIITKPDAEIKHQNHVAAGVGLRNDYRFMTEITDKKDDFNYSVIVSYDQDPGLDVPYTDLTSNTDYLRYAGLDSTSTTKNHLFNQRLYLGTNFSYKNLNFIVNFNQSMKGVYDGGPSFNNGNRLNTKGFNAAINYAKKFTEKLSVKFSAGYYYHTHLLNYEIFRKYYYEIDMQNTGSYDLDFTFFYKPNKQWEFTTGLYRRTTYSILQISDFGYYGLNYGAGKSGLPEGEHFSTHALYEQITYKPTDRIQFIGGLRVEHLEPYNMYYTRGVVSEDSADNRSPNDPSNRTVIEAMYQPENNGFLFSPRLAMIIEAFKDNYFKLLYGQATNRPSFTENYRQLLGNRPTLQASFIQTFELNYFNNHYEKMVINASGFFNKLNNLIKATNVYNVEDNTWDLYSTNSGDLYTIGGELSLKIYPSKSLAINLSGILQETTDQSDGYENFSAAYSPKSIFYGDVTYRMLHNVTLSGVFKYTGSMETDIYFDTDEATPTWKRIGDASPAITVIDLNIRLQDLFFDNTYANIRVNNLLDTEIRYPTTKSNAWIDKGALDLPRSFLLTLGYKF